MNSTTSKDGAKESRAILHLKRGALTVDQVLDACRSLGLDYRADEHSPTLWHARCPVCIVNTERRSLAIREIARGAPARIECRNGCDGAEVLRKLAPALRERGASTTLQAASELEPKAVRWLWWPFVPLGKITAVAGQMGQAKSLWTHWLASATTHGRGLNLSRAGDVVLLSAEDDPEDTTVPRLIAAGADLRRIHFATDLELDAGAISEHCERIGDVRLIVVDPLNAYFGERVDSWKSQHVRRALEPVRRFAQERAIAIVVVQHLNRRGDTPDALARIADSQGIPALARSVLVWGPSPADPEGDGGTLKVLTRAKNNLARGGAAAAFRIEETTIAGGIRAPRLVHIGESDARAEDVTTDHDTRTQTAAAMAFLREHLSGGAQEAEAVKAAAGAADISSKCLRTARERLCRSFRPAGNHGPYFWELVTTDNKKGIQGHSQIDTGHSGVPVDALDALDAHTSEGGNAALRHSTNPNRAHAETVGTVNGARAAVRAIATLTDKDEAERAWLIAEEAFGPGGGVDEAMCAVGPPS